MKRNRQVTPGCAPEVHHLRAFHFVVVNPLMSTAVAAALALGRCCWACCMLLALQARDQERWRAASRTHCSNHRQRRHDQAGEGTGQEDSEPASIGVSPSLQPPSPLWHDVRLANFVCGLAAGLVAKLVTHPLDVAKKRYQVAGLQRSLRWVTLSGRCLGRGSAKREQAQGMFVAGSVQCALRTSRRLAGQVCAGVVAD
jgi:hypothetical protein